MGLKLSFTLREKTHCEEQSAFWWWCGTVNFIVLLNIIHILNSSKHYISETSKNEQLIVSETMCLGRGEKIRMIYSIQSNRHVPTLKLFEQSAAIIWTQRGSKKQEDRRNCMQSSCIICTPHNVWLGDLINGTEFCGASSIHGREVHTKCWLEEQ